MGLLTMESIVHKAFPKRKHMPDEYSRHGQLIAGLTLK